MDARSKDKLQAWLKLPFKRNWAKGSRLDHFQSYVTVYADALLDDTDDQPTQAVIDSAINTYFEKFSWRDPTSHEPPASPPDPNEVLNEEDTDLKGLVIAKMRSSVTNWLHYRAIKSVPYHNLKKLDKDDPFAILLGNLTGLAKPGKRLAGWQEFLKFGFEGYREDFDNKVKAENIPKKRQATERNQYAQAVFSKLDPNVQAQWNQKAKERHDLQVQEWQAQKSSLTTLTPQQRQDAIRRLGDFFFPIIEGASTILKMHVSVIVGGPEPAKGGTLNALSLHAGHNRDAVPKTWGEANPTKFDQVTANFLEYIETCYSRQDRLDSSISGDPNVQTGGGRLMATSHTTHRSTEVANAPSSNRSSALESTSRNHDAPPKKSSRSKHTKSRHRRHRSQSRSPRKRRGRPVDSSSSEDFDDEYTSQASDSDSNDDSNQQRGSRRKHHKHSPRQRSPHSRSQKKSQRGRKRARHTQFSEDEEVVPSKKSQGKRRKNRSVTPDATDNQSPPESSPPPPLEGLRIGPPRSRRAPLLPTQEEHAVSFAYPTEPTRISPVHLDAPECDPFWPEWIRSFYPPLRDMKKMPAEWYTLLAAYVCLEKQTGFDNPTGRGSSLPAQHRPEEIGWWVKCARDREVELTDIDEFRGDWWKWWGGMQPAWRNVLESDEKVTVAHRVHPIDISEQAEAWTELDKPGQNGFLSVLASLGWWAETVNLANPHRLCWTLVVPQGIDWIDAVYDVIWALQRLHASRQNRQSQASAPATT